MIREWKRHIGRRSGPRFAGCDLKQGAPVDTICSRSVLRIVWKVRIVTYTPRPLT